LLLALALPLAAMADDGAERVKAGLMGFQEVPAIASSGTAAFRAKIAEDERSFQWELTFSGLTNVTQAHIHFGQRSVNGAIVIWLCSNLASPPTPAGVQACPTSAGTVRGTATARDVGAVPAQGISAGDFAKILDAIRAGVAYANIHTVAHPPGEIRGQIDGHDD
jgi:hypothetical protein